MRTPQELKSIHQNLQKLYPNCLTLLGGSYSRDEAHEDSDVDFYVVSSFFGFIKNLVQINIAKNLKKQFPFISIVFLPYIAFNNGWYDLQGKDLNNKIYKSGENTLANLRNSLKLGILYCLISLLAVAEKDKKIYYTKSVHRLAMVRLLLGNIKGEAALFSAENLDKHLTHHDYYVNPYALLDKFLKLYKENKEKIIFTWSDYLIYNFHFLKKGNIGFLFCNPSRKVLDKAFWILNKENPNYSSAYIYFKKIAFPIYIV